MVGVRAAARKAGLKLGAGRDADTRRDAGRRSREVAIAADCNRGDGRGERDRSE